jgi:hypothetical protein
MRLLRILMAMIPSLAAMALTPVGAGFFGDEGAFGFGLHGIEQPDRHLIELGGPDGSGVEDLGAEVSEFGGFFEAELFDGDGLFDDAGVVVVHAVDIGPDLADGGIDGGGDEGSAVVAAASLRLSTSPRALRQI